jgi:uncharacterized membrane protein
VFYQHYLFSEAVVSPVLLLLSFPCSEVCSEGFNSEDSYSSVADGSVVIFGVVNAGLCGACCESVVNGVSAAVVVVVIGLVAGAGCGRTVLETIGVSDCVRSALTGAYAVCSGLTISCTQGWVPGMIPSLLILLFLFQ